MPYALRQWPSTVYPEEADEFPEAQADIDVALRALRAEGPRPEGQDVKTLGKEKDGLWQLSLRVRGRQIRILYAPYRQTIIVFRIHKKSSQQEQQRAYVLAMRRKREAEHFFKIEGIANVGPLAVN